MRIKRYFRSESPNFYRVKLSTEEGRSWVVDTQAWDEDHAKEIVTFMWRSMELKPIEESNMEIGRINSGEYKYDWFTPCRGTKSY